ncbi:MAG: response regulator [Planctomycetota bacterium]|jgi:DNA-binding NarL/FixJ family response regulator
MKKRKEHRGKSRILIVDDHTVVRQGLMLLINQEPDLEVCAEAENAAEALEIIEEQEVDLAIVDISLDGPNGIQLTERIKSQYPTMPVLVLTMHDEALYVKRAFQAGAKGYVTKHEAADTIITAIRLMLSGKDYISETMTQKFLKKLNSKGSHC